MPTAITREMMAAIDDDLVVDAMDLAERFDTDGLHPGELHHLTRLARILRVSVDDLRDATR